MPNWDLILDDSFTHADTAYGGANSSAAFPETPSVGVAGGWFDLTGNTWEILGNEAFSNDGGAGGHLYRSDAALADQQAVFWPDTSLANVTWAPEICFSVGDRNSYRLNLSTSFIGPYLAAYVNDTFVRNVGSLTVTGVFNATHQYSITMSRTLTGGVSTLDVSILDTTTGTPYASLMNATDSTAGLQRAGVVALYAASAHARVRRVQWYTGAFSLGDPTPTGNTTTTVSLTIAAALGGAAPVTYQWYRLPTFATAPGPGNLIAGATGLTLTDTPPGGDPGQIYAYKVRATDGTSATVDSHSIGACLAYPAEPVLSIGDSITAIIDTVLAAQLGILVQDRTITVLDHGHSGAHTSDWLPGAGTSYLTNAINAAVAAGCKHAMLMLGANDARGDQLVSAADYKANLAAIVAELLNGHGVQTVTLHGPGTTVSGGGGNQWTDAGMDLILAYHTAQDQLVNGTTILKGDRQALRYTLMNPSATPDGIHPQLPVPGTNWALMQASSFAASNGLIGAPAVSPEGGGGATESAWPEMTTRVS